MTQKVVFTRHHNAPREAQYATEALQSGHVTGDGPFTRRASALLREALGCAEVLLTTSCTHALEMMALLEGWGPGDEVVMPSFTFSSTANAVALRGATVRFAEVDPLTFTMELEQLQAAITPKTRGVIAVSYGGVTRSLPQMVDFCQARGLTLLEDNAHGLFASLGGKPLGTFGRSAALSFHGTKNISCGEGGALILNDPALVDRALMIREKGTDRTLFLRGQVDKYTWRRVGSSYLPSDVLAAVLTAQLEHADWTQRRRLEIWQTYRDILAPEVDALGAQLQAIPEGLDHPAHVFALLVPRHMDRALLQQAMRDQGLATTSHYEPLHLAPAHQGQEVLPVTCDVASRILRLPLHANMEVEDARRVGQALLNALKTGGTT